MSRGRHNIKFSDTSRLIRAAVAAGQVVERIEHDQRTGTVAVVVRQSNGDDGEVSNTPNPWDDLKS